MSVNPKLYQEHRHSKECHALIVFECTRDLQTLSWQQIHQNNRRPAEFVPFCIEEDCEWFILIADQSYTRRLVSAAQTKCILYGVGNQTFIERFAETAPKEYDRFLRHPPRLGFVTCLIFTGYDVEILDLKPNNFGHLM